MENHLHFPQIRNLGLHKTTNLPLARPALHHPPATGASYATSFSTPLCTFSLFLFLLVWSLTKRPLLQRTPGAERRAIQGTHLFPVLSTSRTTVPNPAQNNPFIPGQHPPQWQSYQAQMIHRLMRAICSKHPMAFLHTRQSWCFARSHAHGSFGFQYKNVLVAVVH